MLKVLVVDDERPIVEAVAYNLKKEGFQVLTASDAEECLETVKREKPDLIVLDVMLPSASGFDVCRQIRNTGNETPVIMLTARAEESDRVVGLELGADDYVTKPFSMRELIARVKSVLKRTANLEEKEVVIEIDDIAIFPARHEVQRKGEIIPMSRKEFALLHFLATHKGQIFSRQTILDRVWGDEAFVEERTIDVHIRWLREKIEENPSQPHRLLTVRGVGYKFNG